MAPDTKPCRSALVCSCHVPSCYLHDPDGNFTKDHGFRSFWPFHPAKVLWVAAWCAPRFSAGQRLPQNHSHLSPQQVSDKESLRSGRRVGGARPRPNTEKWGEHVLVESRSHNAAVLTLTFAFVKLTLLYVFWEYHRLF